MTRKVLPKADNYFMFPFDNGVAVGISKNGICYRIDDSGALLPVCYGDEFTTVYADRIAVRKGQNVQII